ncbi:MAG: hypothetical protein IJU40_01220 [Desulfovibrionaceae bacterium]|nr:hypothetical protein [Desulfovibrionaceae bacterium]
MDTYLNLRLPGLEQPPLSDTFSYVKHFSAHILATRILKDRRFTLPSQAKEIELFATHMRPHLDEYMAMLLFRSCLDESQWNLPLEETILKDAVDDQQVRTAWEKACVFGLGKVHSCGAEPLLIFDEHSQQGDPKTDSSAVALVYHALFDHRFLPQPLFILCREVDLLDACGGAHPKHLSTYLARLHDFSDSSILDPLSVNDKQAVIEACLIASVWASSQQVAFWENKFWQSQVLDSLQESANNSPLRLTDGFESALETLKRNLTHFRQPSFPANLSKDSKLCFNSQGKRVFQCLVIPFLIPLLPLVWGEIGQRFVNILWNTRLMSQIRYNNILQLFEEHLGSDPSDSDIETTGGKIGFRICHKALGQLSPAIWVLAFAPKVNKGNVRQAMISYVRKHNADCALTIIFDQEYGSMVLSRGGGFPAEVWQDLVNWLLQWEGSSDVEDQPGCWHALTNPLGKHADFVLNGNATHRYAPPSKLTPDVLIDWLNRYSPKLTA